MLLLDRARACSRHHQFSDFPRLVRPGTVLVINSSQVIKARLYGDNVQTGGQFELLLLEENAPNDWWVMIKPGRRARVGTQIRLRNPATPSTEVTALVIDVNSEGHRRVHFGNTPNILRELDQLGEIPLPPYIRRPSHTTLPIDAERYQTIYANDKGSLAAPTAGLHFTSAVLARLQEQNANVARITLHVGLGTFAPVKADNIEDHVMHEERFEVSAESARIINAAKAEGRAVLAVGTTTLRVLESLGRIHDGVITPGTGRTRIFIHPPSTFRVVDALLTNFHLPRSTLLMLVSAFAAPGETKGREIILNAYAEAIRERYRFFSYGDAMLIL